MKVTLRHRDGSKKTFESNSDVLIEALKEIQKRTLEEDETGYFFETEFADREAITGPVFVDEYGVEVSCEIV